MRRINISVEEGITDEEAAASILAVIRQGRISNDEKSYCYVTTLSNKITVAADLTRTGNDTFRVWRERK